MKIRKLVAETDVKTTKSNVKANDLIGDNCIASQQDYEGAIECIQNAIDMLAHVIHCNKDDVVAKESVANLAVVLLDLQSNSSAANVDALVDNELITEEGL